MSEMSPTKNTRKNKITQWGMSLWQNCTKGKQNTSGREPWSSGYGSRPTFQRSWVRIPAPDTGWT